MTKQVEMISSPNVEPGDPSVKIAVVGCGYVGLVAAVCFAEMGHKVICVDNDSAKIAALQNGQIPIHEDHLEQLLRRQSKESLTFSTSLSDAVRTSEAVFIAVGTPPMENGDADLSYVEAVAVEIARSIDAYRVIVEKSTVPVYTSDWISRVLHRHGVARDEADVVSNPEFLREGTAVRDFLHPDRIVVGTGSDRAFRVLARIYRPLTDGSYYRQEDSLKGPCNDLVPPPLLRTSAKSAELIKHASNAFLAMKISFINSIANVCEAVDADIEEVARGMGLDRRIGPRFLKAGLGYGGSCFPKDLKAFYAISQQVGATFDLLKEVERVNERQQKLFLNKVRSTLWNLRRKKLAVLGLAFKGGTDDIRESPAINLVRSFLAEGCSIAAYDPAATENARRLFSSDNIFSNQNITFTADPYQAMKDADALVILTDWPEFALLDLKRVKARLANPIIFDGRNMFSCDDMVKEGFTYICIGRPATEDCGELLQLARRAS
jgi:UDPglucose 6-dehydrogenase